MKKTLLLVLAMTLVFSVPVLAVEGEVETGVEFSEEDLTSVTYFDFNADFAGLLDEDTAADLAVLADAPDAELGDIDIKIGPSAEYTGVDYLTLGVAGSLDDDFMLEMQDAEDDARVWTNLYANVAVDDVEEGLEFGVNNDLDIRNVKEDDDDDIVWINEDEIAIENYLTINPYADYVIEVAEGLDVGAENEMTIERLDGYDSQELSLKPLANYETELAEGLTYTADNSLEVKFAGDEDDFLESDDEVLVSDHELNYVTDIDEGIEAGVDNAFNVEYNDVLGDIEDETLEISTNPYLNLDLEPAADTTVDAGTDFELVEDLDGDEDSQTLTVTNQIEYTGVEYVTAGVKGAVDNDDDVDNEWIVVEELDFGDELSFATEAYANVEVEATDELTVGSNNNATVELEAENPWEVVPFANYETGLADDLTFNADADYTLLDGDVLAPDAEFANSLEAEVKLTYTF